MNIMGIGAHPDDLELCCGGTLARYSREGHKVVMISATNGDKGHNSLPPEKISAIRKEELAHSAALIGAGSHCMQIADEFLVNDLQTRLMMVDVLRKFKPDLIITHDPNDCHVDHQNTSKLVFEAASLSFVPAVKTEYPAHPVFMPIYYMETLLSFDFIPEEYVDITETFAIKKKMLLEHQSQFAMMNSRVGSDLADVIEVTSRFRGLQAGVKYAEAFRLLKTGLRMPTKRLLP
jgi:N-acetylglucosamine malate deacetylase 1